MPTPHAHSATGRMALALVGCSLLIAATSACGATATYTTYTTYTTYHFCICQKGANQWQAGAHLSFTWLAQDDGTTTDPAPHRVTLTLEVRGPFSTVVPLPSLDQVRHAPLLLTSSITTTDQVGQDQTATAQVPNTVQPGDYIVIQTSTMGSSTSPYNGWTEFHPITIGL